MKSLKAKLSVIALVLGFGAAVASTPRSNFTNQTWGKESTGAYVNVTGQHEGTDYTCSGSTGICTAVYPAGQNPNSNPANPVSTVAGAFSN